MRYTVHSRAAGVRGGGGPRCTGRAATLTAGPRRATHKYCYTSSGRAGASVPTCRHPALYSGSRAGLYREVMAPLAAIKPALLSNKLLPPGRGCRSTFIWNPQLR